MPLLFSLYIIKDLKICLPYRLGPEVFALAPFIDLANHSIEPNSDFRMKSSPSSSSSIEPLKPSSIELFAIKDIQQGDEVLISYTGPEGLTNQRLMAQYGFVLPGGNPGDRVPLEIKGGAK